MKYFFSILLTLILAVAVVTGVYYYTNDRTLPGQTKDTFITTATKPAATEKYSARKLIASLDKQGFRLYKSGSSVILEHKDNEFTFDNWSKVIDEETPKMYYSDFDGDGEKELVIRAVSGQDDSTGEYVYELYILNPKKGKKEDYSVLLVSQDTWRTVLDDQVTEELSQLKSCRKVLQFAMDDKSSPIKYNSKTGIAENAAYVGYAKALQDDNGKYMTLFGWTKSKGMFFIDDDNNIKVEVDCIANYDETHIVQNLGKVYFTLTITSDNKLTVKPKSMYFKANDKFKVSDPTDRAKKKWAFTRNNSFVPKDGGTVNWAKYQIKIDKNTFTDTVDFANEETDIKYVKQIKLTQSDVLLIAADGYTFSSDPVEKGDFSVTVNKGAEDEYEISYTAKISDDLTSVRITFDKSYAQKKVRTVDISYGSK